VAAEREPASISMFERRPATGNPRVPIVVIAVVAVIAGLWAAKVLLIPIVLAALVSFGLEPLHRRLVAWHVPRGPAAAFLLTALVAALGASAWTLQAQAMTVVNQLPAATQKLRDIVMDVRALGSTVQPVQKAAEELQRAADGPTGSAAPKGVSRVQVEEPPARVSDLLWRGTMGMIAFLAEATVVLFLAYYLLSSGDRYKQKIVAIAGPSPRRRRIAIDVLNRITLSVERFIVARFVLSVLVGVGTTAALMALDVSQAVIWGVVAGILSNIPYVGPIAAVAAITLAAFLQFGDGDDAAIVFASVSAIALFEGYVLTPWMMGRAGRMNTGAVFVSLMFWGWIWGLWGMLFAVPIMMAVKVIAEDVEPLAPLSELLGE
jgi:predicted PurR-regulated permease PerM